MRVLVLGGAGHVGSRLIGALAATDWAEPLRGRRPGGRAGAADGVREMPLDILNIAALSAALRGVDAVVNCVAGSADAISRGTEVLARAALAAGCLRIVHLSTMSVYGHYQGVATEGTPLDPRLGWYGRAKCEAEGHVREFARRGGSAVMLRPGCVHGPGSELWVGRVGRWLDSGRLGDLGAGGDGWSNLVHVDDVCAAVLAALRRPRSVGELRTYNLAAPDSPRWNDYFVDLALAIGARPVVRVSRRRLQLDTKLAGPPLKIGQMLLARAGLRQTRWPDPMPPGLARLWAQHIRLDAGRASDELGLAWTRYADGVTDSARWFLAKGRRP
ncbi:MAG: NAD-dependent epimerase/dehydratase family protein [Comamonadaceae bacterium]|nr:MAG: NAD-dependent epimerase/dehydratase family protein [Comamonadaceae bacterium]